MRCRQIKPLISQCIDQTLPPAQVAPLERHLAECASCATLHHEMKGVVSLLRASPPQRAPAGFTAKVMQQVQAEGVPGTPSPLFRWQERLRLVPRWVTVGSLAAVFLTAALVCLRPRPAIGPETQSFVEECMADYELYAAIRPAAETPPLLLGSWGLQQKRP